MIFFVISGSIILGWLAANYIYVVVGAAVALAIGKLVYESTTVDYANDTYTGTTVLQTNVGIDDDVVALSTLTMPLIVEEQAVGDYTQDLSDYWRFVILDPVKYFEKIEFALISVINPQKTTPMLEQNYPKQPYAEPEYSLVPDHQFTEQMSIQMNDQSEDVVYTALRTVTVNRGLLMELVPEGEE